MNIKWQRVSVHRGFSGFLSSGTKILTLKGQRPNSNRAKTIFQLMSDWTFLVVLIRPNRGSKIPQKYLSAWSDFRLNTSWHFDHSLMINHVLLSQNFDCFTTFFSLNFRIWNQESKSFEKVWFWGYTDYFEQTYQQSCYKRCNQTINNFDFLIKISVNHTLHLTGIK